MSIARATVSSDVSAPLIISTSFILSTGEKKCRPIKSFGRGTLSASPVMGSVEVLEHNRQSSEINSSASANTFALRFASSKTASISASMPARSDADSVGVMRARISSRFSAVMRPRSTAFVSNFSEWALPFSAAASETSFKTTFMPARAHSYAIPAPIMPAPRIPTLVTARLSKPAGRSESPVRLCRSKKKA